MAGHEIIGLRQVAQHADDLDRATAFYRDVVGLRHLATFEPPGLVFFDLGDGTRLLLEGGARRRCCTSASPTSPRLRSGWPPPARCSRTILT